MTECNCSRTIAEQAGEILRLQAELVTSSVTHTNVEYVRKLEAELAALRSQQAEPVGKVRHDPDDYGDFVEWANDQPPAGTILYASPPQETQGQTQGPKSSSGLCSASNGITADAPEGYRLVKTDLHPDHIAPFKYYPNEGFFMINGKEYRLVSADGDPFPEAPKGPK